MALIGGICKYCGCTDTAPCVFDRGDGPEACAWVDEDRDLCTSPACVKRAYDSAVDVAFAMIAEVVRNAERLDL